MIGDFLNGELYTFGLTQEVVRTLMILTIGLAAFLLPKEMRSHWLDWKRRQRRINLNLFGVVVVIGALTYSALLRDDPVRVGTGLLWATFISTNAAMLLRFVNDETTDRQYAHWFQRSA